MELILCSIYDKASNTYVQPFCVRHMAEAKRMFSMSVNDKRDGSMSVHPEDFTLVRLGVFDDNSGVVVCNGPERIANGTEFKAPD